MNPTPFIYRNLVGRAANYYIHEGYISRLDPEPHDDTKLTDQFQREVYEYARQVFDQQYLQGVCDVGCGSGYKLMEFFAGQCLLGIELPAVVEFLCKTYPAGNWKAIDLATDDLGGFYRLVICADVIEHLTEPDVLLEFLARSGATRIILSTPERDLLNHCTSDGPPRNIHHVREWNWAQFHAYVGSRFEILEHFVCGVTQIVDCRIL